MALVRVWRALVRVVRIVGLLALIVMSALMIATLILVPPVPGEDLSTGELILLVVGFFVIIGYLVWLLLCFTKDELHRTQRTEIDRRIRARLRRHEVHALSELRRKAEALRGTCPLRSDPRAPEGPYERAVDGSPLSEREAEMAVLVGESIDTGLRQWSGTWELPEGRQVQEIREAARELAALARADEPESPHAADVLRLCAWIDGQQGTELGRGELF